MTSFKLILQLHHSTYQASYIIHRDLTSTDKSCGIQCEPLVVMLSKLLLFICWIFHGAGKRYAVVNSTY